MSTYLEPPLSQATIAGRQIAWREAGPAPVGDKEEEGVPLVLMHGIGSNARAWAGQFAAFAPNRRVIAWNAPGYAGSDPLNGPSPSARDYAQSMLGLLDALAIDRFVLVGQSLGAIMATALATAAADRVVGLALASPASGYAVPAGDPLPERVTGRIDDVLRFGPAGLADRRASRLLTDRADSAARSLVHGAMTEIVPQGYVQASHMLAHANLAAMVARLAVPTLVMWGDADVITPPAGCRAIADAVPGGTYHVFANLGHAFATEAPAEFNAALVPMISRADALYREYRHGSATAR